FFFFFFCLGVVGVVVGVVVGAWGALFCWVGGFRASWAGAVGGWGGVCFGCGVGCVCVGGVGFGCCFCVGCCVFVLFGWVVGFVVWWFLFGGFWGCFVGFGGCGFWVGVGVGCLVLWLVFFCVWVGWCGFFLCGCVWFVGWVGVLWVVWELGGGDMGAGGEGAPVVPAFHDALFDDNIDL
ncbi:hypothetical protein RA276_27845, partial [Pseudomonas syringae pv. tagetis]|uniref:hypothetical protein n=1 Tax=Pseudomonas syringae group genomosp. 7 TaxID=251699 RepID=UPI00376FE542